jgi:hypothetical protein
MEPLQPLQLVEMKQPLQRMLPQQPRPLPPLLHRVQLLPCALLQWRVACALEALRSRLWVEQPLEQHPHRAWSNQLRQSQERRRRTVQPPELRLASPEQVRQQRNGRAPVTPINRTQQMSTQRAVKAVCAVAVFCVCE